MSRIRLIGTLFDDHYTQARFFQRETFGISLTKERDAGVIHINQYRLSARKD